MYLQRVPLDLYFGKEKSRNMFNLSKSQGLMSETFNDLLETILKNTQLIMTEQTHQREDLAIIKRKVHALINDNKLQKSVDEYFEEPHPLEDK